MDYVLIQNREEFELQEFGGLRNQHWLGALGKDHISPLNWLNDL